MSADDYYDVWLEIVARTSRPRFFDLILDRAGVSLERDLLPYLVHVSVHAPIGVLELAELLEVNHPKVSRSLARLERLGLISRSTSPTDHRVRTASLTGAGRRTIEAFNLGRRRVLDEAFAGWTQDDQRRLARLTKRFADDMFALIEGHAQRPPGE